MLYIYAAVLNNAHRIEQCLRSLKPLKPQKYFVVDSFSKDGTFELLKQHGNVIVTQYKCGLGKGRDLALRMALKECKDDDFLMYVDLDTIYKKAWIRQVSRKIKTLKHNEMFILGQLSTVKTNRNLYWNDLYGCEDIERVARAKKAGVKLYTKVTPRLFTDRYNNELVNNDPEAGQRADIRMKRYSSGKINHVVRMARSLSDCERAHAFKSYKDFYKIAGVKSPQAAILFAAAYVLGRIRGVYSYNKDMDNDTFVYGKGSE